MPRAILPAKDFAHRALFLLWTDALCFREMAKQAPDKYLQSMCVRNSVLSAWTTLEMACCDALGVDELRGTLLETLNNELENRGKSRLDFSSGFWQQVKTTVRSNRKTYSHFGVKCDEERIPPVSVAEDAIRYIRLSIEDIYKRMGKDCPRWIMTDHVAGWPERRGIGITHAALSAIEAGANPSSPDVIKLTLVREDGKEDDYRYFPPNTSDAVLNNWVEDILTGGLLNFPYTKLRVYHGGNFLAHEFEAR
jgi:hypothetical protein